MDWELVHEAPEDSCSKPSPHPGRNWGHCYSAHLIRNAIELVLSANNSFRGAATSLEILFREAGEYCPSFWSVRNWVLRLGLYELQRPKQPAEDWAVILDHTIQLGQHTALLALGVRLGELAQGGFNLAHQDVTVLALELCERSNGEKVLDSIERIKEQIGQPRLLISDGGSDIKKAAEVF